MRFSNPQKRERRASARARRWPTCSCRSSVGGDLALFQLVNRRAGSTDGRRLDKAFIAEHCDGFDELAAHLAALDPDALLAGTGLTARRGRAGRPQLVGDSERIIVCWAMGLTQHKAGGRRRSGRSSTPCCCAAASASRAPACARCAATATCRATARWASTRSRPTAFLDALARRVRRSSRPASTAYDTVDAIRAMARGEVDVFVAMGGNFVAAAPDTDATDRGARAAAG